MHHKKSNLSALLYVKKNVELFFSVANFLGKMQITFQPSYLLSKLFDHLKRPFFS